MTEVEEFLAKLSRICSDPQTPCVQCGQCCIDMPCGLGKLNRKGQCKHLLHEDGKHPCSLASTPRYAKILGIGCGCLGNREASLREKSQPNGSSIPTGTATTQRRNSQQTGNKTRKSAAAKDVQQMSHEKSTPA